MCVAYSVNAHVCTCTNTQRSKVNITLPLSTCVWSVCVCTRAHYPMNGKDTCRRAHILKYHNSNVCLYSKETDHFNNITDIYRQRLSSSYLRILEPSAGLCYGGISVHRVKMSCCDWSNKNPKSGQQVGRRGSVGFPGREGKRRRNPGAWEKPAKHEEEMGCTVETRSHPTAGCRLIQMG